MAENFLTRKAIGGVPNFVLIAGGVVALYVLRGRQTSGSNTQQQQAQQQAALAAQLAQQEQLLAGYGSGAQQGSQVLVLSPDGSGTPAASTPAETAPSGITGEVQQGSGYWTPNSTSPVTGYNGDQYVWIPNPAALAGVPSSDVYVQSDPGVFQPFNPKVHYAGGTPLYQSIP